MSMNGYSVNYALTVTLRPLMYKHEPEHQYDVTYDYVRRKLLSLTEHFTLICEMTKSYNVHYHAVLSLPLNDTSDCQKKIHKLFRNDPNVGFIYVKQVTDFDKWIEYIRKDIVKTCSVLNRRPIIHDWYDQFDLNERDKYGITW